MFFPATSRSGSLSLRNDRKGQWASDDEKSCKSGILLEICGRIKIGMLTWNNDISLKEALGYVCQKIYVVYKGKGSTLSEKVKIFQEHDISVRQCKILTPADWREISKSFRYGDDKTIDEFAEQDHIKKDPKYTQLYSKKNLRAVTALDTKIGKRLLVDGGHTCSAIRWELKKGTIGNFPEVIIYEFFGNQISNVFYGDYPNLLKKK